MPSKATSSNPGLHSVLQPRAWCVLRPVKPGDDTLLKRLFLDGSSAAHDVVDGGLQAGNVVGLVEEGESAAGLDKAAQHGFGVS
jgi:hypothetical protein